MKDISERLQRLLKEAKAPVKDLEGLSDKAGKPLPGSYDGFFRELNATRIAALQRGLGRQEGIKLDPVGYPPRGMNRNEAAVRVRRQFSVGPDREGSQHASAEEGQQQSRLGPGAVGRSFHGFAGRGRKPG